MRWFRLYHEFATDPEVQSLSEADQRRYVMLLCLKGNGDLPGLSDEKIAFAMRISLEELEKTKNNLLEMRFITKNWGIRGWNKRQYKSDTSTERVQRYRNRAKPFLEHPQSRDRTDTEKNKTLGPSSKTPPKKSKKFKKPTPQQVEEYAKSIDYEINPGAFVDHYEAKGWMLGKTSMKDWQAAVRTWKRRDSGKPQGMGKDLITPHEARVDLDRHGSLYDQYYSYYETVFKDRPDEWVELKGWMKERFPESFPSGTPPEEEEEMVDLKEVALLLGGLGESKRMPEVEEEE